MLSAIANFALPILKNAGQSLLSNFLSSAAPRVASSLANNGIILQPQKMKQIQKITNKAKLKMNQQRRKQKQLMKNMRQNPLNNEQQGPQQQQQIIITKKNSNKSKPILKRARYLRKR